MHCFPAVLVGGLLDAAGNGQVTLIQVARVTSCVRGGSRDQASDNHRAGRCGGRELPLEAHFGPLPTRNAREFPLHFLLYQYGTFPQNKLHAKYMVYLTIRTFLISTTVHSRWIMIDNTSEKIEEFIALFNGNIPAAHAALDAYRKQQSVTTISRSTPHSVGGEVIISVQNISKRYKLGEQTVDALNDVSLSIDKGEFVAITGASGSGKSTLLQIIGCLDKPTSGVVSIDAKETTELSDSALSELRQNAIGFIFQSFYLQPFLRLNDNLAVPAMFTNEKKQAIDDKVELLLQQVGLSERSRHFPKELSGGQIQRAAIARALVNSPRIILADEPTGNLDSTNSKSVIDLFRTIRDKLGTTIVVVTHDVEIARQADRVIELKDGAVV